eukprot:COSAG04_NODE_804_length_10157_cov_2.622688_8_plen_91_part_00
MVAESDAQRRCCQQVRFATVIDQTYHKDGTASDLPVRDPLARELLCFCEYAQPHLQSRQDELPSVSRPPVRSDGGHGRDGCHRWLSVLHR